MPIYKYNSVNDQGRKIRGEMTAANEIDLEERLRELGLDYIGSREVKEKKSGVFSRVKLRDMILFCIQMEQLSRAGVPMLDALADARDASESPKLRDILAEVYESVKGGEVLSDALRKNPKLFDEVFVGLVAAGEKTGDLTRSFAHLSMHLKWVGEIKRKVRKAMSYPIMLLVVIIVVISVLMLFVVPKLTDFMLAQGFELPIHTRALIAFSHFVGSYWHVTIASVVVIVASLVTLYRVSENFAYAFDNLMINFPAVGGTVRKIDMARFARFFGVMFRSGIDILECLDGAGRVVNNRVLKESIKTVRRSVSEGNSLTESLRISAQFPNLVVRMFKVGEESGNMNAAMDNINYFYDREVEDAVDGMVGMVQPAMTVILGTMILWVVSGVFGPLYDSFSKMNF